MNNDFQYMVFFLAVIALLFVGLSLMPQLRVGGSRAQAPVTLAAGPPLAAPSAAPSSPAASAAPPPPPVAAAPHYKLRRQRTEASRDVTWLFTLRAVILLKDPGGDPYTADSLCDAPLTICPGTRLWPVETQGEWVMVRSPSQILGWIPQSEVSDRAPIVKRVY